MSFFKKMKERMFRSSSKLDEGLEAIVETPAAPARACRPAARTCPRSRPAPASSGG
jgi:fused signal recognition particle receptor